MRAPRVAVAVVPIDMGDARQVLQAVRRFRDFRPREYTGAEEVSTDQDDPSSRFVGTASLTDIYKRMTPGQGEEPAKEDDDEPV